MANFNIVQRIPLRPFRIDIRDKTRIRALLKKLDVDVLGWNAAELLARYHYQLDRRLPEEYHARQLLKLVAILVSGNNEELINNPDARLDDTSLDDKTFKTFTIDFLDGLKTISCGPSELGEELVDPQRSYIEGLYGAMTSFVYSKMNYRSPFVGLITMFMIILLSYYYPTSFCNSDSRNITESMMAKLKL
jgi:hypothetical protein